MNSDYPFISDRPNMIHGSGGPLKSLFHQ